jgi:hypothetical protein
MLAGKETPSSFAVKVMTTVCGRFEVNVKQVASDDHFLPLLADPANTDTSGKTPSLYPARGESPQATVHPYWFQAPGTTVPRQTTHRHL